MTQKPSSPNQSQQSKDFSLDVQFLQSLNMLISSARVYQDNNSLLVSAVQDFVAVIVELSKEDDEITLLAAPGRFYLQHEKIAHRSSIAGLISSMLLFFEKRKISGLRFTPAIAEVSPAVITSFAGH